MANEDPPAAPPPGHDAEEETHTALPTMGPGGEAVDNFSPDAKTLLTPIDSDEEAEATRPRTPPRMPIDASGLLQVDADQILGETGGTALVGAEVFRPGQRDTADFSPPPADEPPEQSVTAPAMAQSRIEDDEDETDTALTAPPPGSEASFEPAVEPPPPAPPIASAPTPPAPPASPPTPPAPPVGAAPAAPAPSADVDLPPTEAEAPDSPMPISGLNLDNEDIHRAATQAVPVEDASALSLAYDTLPLPDEEAAQLLQDPTDPSRTSTPSAAPTEPGNTLTTGAPTAARMTPTYANLVVEENEVEGVSLKRWQVKPSEAPSSAPVAPPAQHVPAPLIRTRLQTVLFQAEDDEGDGAPARRHDDENVDAPEPSNWTPPTMARAGDDDLRLAVQYLHDALEELEELRPFAQELGKESRRGFQAAVMGCTQKLKRAMALLPGEDAEES